MFFWLLRSLGIVSRRIYETSIPPAPELVDPAILVFSKANGFIHKEALAAGKEMSRSIADDNGWGVYFTRNGAVHSPKFLAKFRVLIWNNVSGDVLTQKQRSALKSWIEEGGAWIGLHASGGDFRYDWAWYVEKLVGAQFVGHTMNPHLQDAELVVEDTQHPITAHLNGSWWVQREEWYAFRENPQVKGCKVLLSVDESSYVTQGKSWAGTDRMKDQHPIVWCQDVGEGKAFYSGIGHCAITYERPQYRTLIENAIIWGMEK